MTAVRDFLVAFGVVSGVLMALVSFVFVGSTLMNEFAGLSEMGRALVAAAATSIFLAVPIAAVGTSRDFLQIDRNAA